VFSVAKTVAKKASRRSQRHAHPAVRVPLAICFVADSIQSKRGSNRRPANDQRLTTNDGFYVPSFHPAKYSSCSGVSRSILIPIDSSFSLATRLSSSSGTRYTVFSSFL
jgi:hypothetical protein